MGIPCPFRALCGSKPRPSEYAKVERSGVGVLTAGSCCGGVRPFAGATRAAKWGFRSAFFFLVCLWDGASVRRHGSVPWGFLQEQRGDHAQEPPLCLPSSELQRNQGATKNSRRNR